MSAVTLDSASVAKLKQIDAASRHSSPTHQQPHHHQHTQPQHPAALSRLLRAAHTIAVRIFKNDLLAIKGHRPLTYHIIVHMATGKKETMTVQSFKLHKQLSNHNLISLLFLKQYNVNNKGFFNDIRCHLIHCVCYLVLRLPLIWNARSNIVLVINSCISI